MAEASREALILFEENAVREITDPISFIAQFTRPIDLRPYGLPIYNDGQWRMPPRRDAGEILQPADDVIVDQNERAPEAHDEPIRLDEIPIPKAEPFEDASDAQMKATESDAHDDTQPVLDDQSFTVRHGGQNYRFTARNKQLFALLERISHRPGYRVLYNDLRSIGDVWDGASVEDSTIRGAVARLRKLLKTRGMASLSSRIITGTYRGNGYVMPRVCNAEDCT